MSSNSKFRCFFLALLLLAILFAFGCASISYTPIQENEPWFVKVGPKVFIHKFDYETTGDEIWSRENYEKQFDRSIRMGRWAFFPWYAKLIIPQSRLPKISKNYLERPERLFCGTFSGINCPQLFKDVFTKEFQALGLQVVENINEAQVIMRGRVLLFESVPRLVTKRC